MTYIALLILVALAVGLVRYVRHDALAGAGVRYTPRDELGPLAFRRRPV